MKQAAFRNIGKKSFNYLTDSSTMAEQKCCRTGKIFLGGKKQETLEKLKKIKVLLEVFSIFWGQFCNSSF